MTGPANRPVQRRGQRAIVAAASQGIGRTTAERLAAVGASIAICSRAQAHVDPVAEGINDADHRVEALAV